MTVMILTCTHAITKETVLFDGVLVYRLICSWSDEFDCEIYGAECLARFGKCTETALVSDITSDKERAEHFFSLITENVVFPSSLKDVAEDFAAMQ